MPCRAYFDGEVLRIDFIEFVTACDITELTPGIENLERSRPVVPHRITDLSEASGLNIGFAELFVLAERRKALRFTNAFKSAIIAPQMVHVGLARMFQILNNHPQITIEIFPDQPAASAWIAEV